MALEYRVTPITRVVPRWHSLETRYTFLKVGVLGALSRMSNYELGTGPLRRTTGGPRRCERDTF